MRHLAPFFLALTIPGTAFACGGGSCPVDGTGTALAAVGGIGVMMLLGKLGLFK